MGSLTYSNLVFTQSGADTIITANPANTASGHNPISIKVLNVTASFVSNAANDNLPALLNLAV